MKKNMLFGLTLSAILLGSSSLLMAQDIDKNDVSFDYIRLPLIPIEKGVKNYAIDVIQNAETRNVELKAAYEAKQKAADEKYKLDMAAQQDQRSSQKSTLGSMVVAMQQMDDKNKITRDVVAEPMYLKVFPTEAVTGKINLEGFNKSNEEGLKITVSLLGFEANDLKIEKQGKDPNVTYTYSVEYKNPVNIKVECAGKVYLDELVAASNSMLKYDPSRSFKSEGEAKQDWSNNLKKLSEQLQNNSLDNSLKAANAILNNKFGFMKLKREALLYSVKSKKVDYTDYIEAYNALNEGLLMLGESMLIADGKVKIKEAVDKFDILLKQSNITDKKAKVNQDVTIAIYFNLLEANIWLNEFLSAQKIILKLKTSDLSNREEKRMERIRSLLEEQKIRFDANKVQQ